MNARACLFIAVTVTSTIAAPLYAHHSFAMFDMEKDVAYTGVVLDYKWVNPHVHITVDIKPGQGVDPATLGTWDVEGGSTNIMGRQGWTRATFKPGDPITFVGHPMKDGSKGISLFYVILADGTRLYHDIARPKGEGGK
ncbi:MAG TPA: DUF6152 family protein [Vicinamibacterales bacterium]|jgi:hypothetical protein|nr:DUF6152 family protein [Vicinamibacterales bacterium]